MKDFLEGLEKTGLSDLCKAPLYMELRAHMPELEFLPLFAGIIIVI